MNKVCVCCKKERKIARFPKKGNTSVCINCRFNGGINARFSSEDLVDKTGDYDERLEVDQVLDSLGKYE